MNQAEAKNIATRTLLDKVLSAGGMGVTSYLIGGGLGQGFEEVQNLMSPFTGESNNDYISRQMALAGLLLGSGVGYMAKPKDVLSNIGRIKVNKTKRPIDPNMN